MMGAPSRVNKAQLDDVHIILNDKNNFNNCCNFM